MIDWRASSTEWLHFKLDVPLVLYGRELPPPAIGWLMQWYSYVVLPIGQGHLDMVLEEVLQWRYNYLGRFEQHDDE